MSGDFTIRTLHCIPRAADVPSRSHDPECTASYVVRRLRFRSFKDTTGSVTAAAAAAAPVAQDARIQVMPACCCCARHDENPGKVFGL